MESMMLASYHFQKLMEQQTSKRVPDLDSPELARPFAVLRPLVTACVVSLAFAGGIGLLAL